MKSWITVTFDAKFIQNVLVILLTDEQINSKNVSSSLQKQWRRQRTCLSCGGSVRSHFMMAMSRPPLNRLMPFRHRDWTPSEWFGSRLQRGLMMPAQSDGTRNTCIPIHARDQWIFSICRESEWWCGGATGRTLDLRSIGRGFKSYSEQRCVTTLGKLFAPMCLCHQAV